MDNSNVEEETQPYLKECNFIITKKLEENHISSNVSILVLNITVYFPKYL